MKPNSKLVAVATISSLVALGSAGLVSTASAAKEGMEKCYGVVKAGKNDCATNTTSCAGTATEDNQPDSWVYMPKGMCDKIVGGEVK